MFKLNYWIKYGFVRFANHCISQPFLNWGCIMEISIFMWRCNDSNTSELIREWMNNVILNFPQPVTSATYVSRCWAGHHLYLCSEDRNSLQWAFLLLHLLLQFIDQILLQGQRSLCLLQPAGQISSLEDNQYNTHNSIKTNVHELEELMLMRATAVTYLTLQFRVVVSKETCVGVLQLCQFFSEGEKEENLTFQNKTSNLRNRACKTITLTQKLDYRCAQGSNLKIYWPERFLTGQKL